jgi:hypothetical protein
MAVAAMQATAMQAALGAKVEVVDPRRARSDLDAWLNAVEVPASSDRRVLMDALGLGRAG